MASAVWEVCVGKTREGVREGREPRAVGRARPGWRGGREQNYHPEVFESQSVPGLSWG